MIESISLYVLVFLIVASFIAGFIDSIAGGGGLITLPVTLAAGLPPHLALGTGKLVASCGTFFSLLLYAKSRMVLWKIVYYGIPFSLLGSVLGAKIALFIAPEILGKLLVLLLPFGAFFTLLPKNEKTTMENRSEKIFFMRTSFVCLLMGIYDGFFGPGTGSILILSLHAFLRLDLLAASGTTKAFNSASNIGALVTFFTGNKILYSVGIPMAVANILGNIIGTRIALNKGSKVVRIMLTLSLSLLFCFLVYRFFIQN